MQPAEDDSTESLAALQWARIVLFTKQHGVVAALVLITLYQIGIIADAQQYVCGV